MDQPKFWNQARHLSGSCVVRVVGAPDAGALTALTAAASDSSGAPAALTTKE